MKKNIINLMTFFSFFISCSSVPMYIQVSDRMVGSYEKETKNYGLRLIGSGGSFMKDIKGYDLHYDAKKNLDVTAVRQLYVTTMENLLNKINNDSQVRPYLHVYPFTIDNVKIMISFHTPECKIVNNQYVALVSCVNGKIYYRNYINNNFQDIFVEPYAEALRIVRGG